MTKVAGKAFKLDDRRMVWLARNPERSGSYIVRIIDGEKKNEFITSGEALDALSRLRVFVDAGSEWQLVDGDERGT